MLLCTPRCLKMHNFLKQEVAGRLGSKFHGHGSKFSAESLNLEGGILDRELSALRYMIDTARLLL